MIKISVEHLVTTHGGVKSINFDAAQEHAATIAAELGIDPLHVSRGVSGTGFVLSTQEPDKLGSDGNQSEVFVYKPNLNIGDCDAHRVWAHVRVPMAENFGVGHLEGLSVGVYDLAGRIERFEGALDGALGTGPKDRIRTYERGIQAAYTLRASSAEVVGKIIRAATVAHPDYTPK